MKSVFCIMSVVLVGMCASAKTVAWWRFSDACGQVVPNTTFTNAVNPGVYDATSSSFKNQDNKTTLGIDSAYQPTCTNAFVEWPRLQVVDPVTSNTAAARYGLYCPWGGDGSGLSGGAVVPAVPELWGCTNGVQGDFTFECFFRTTAEGLARSALMEPIAGIPCVNNSSFGAWSLIIYNKKIWARCALKKDSGDCYLSSGNGSTTVTPDVWHHAAITYTHTDKTFRVYLDYKYECGLTFGDAYTDCIDGNANSFLFFGKGTYLNDRSFDGTLAEARFSDAALSTDEFLRLEETHFPGDRISRDADVLYWGSCDSSNSFCFASFAKSNTALTASAEVKMLSTVELVPPEGASTVTPGDAETQTHEVSAQSAAGIDAFDNLGALSFVTNNADYVSEGESKDVNNYYAQQPGYIEITDPNHEIQTGSFTQEMFFKTRHAERRTMVNIPSWSYGLMGSAAFKVIINHERGQIFCRVHSASGDKDSGVNNKVDDGLWHHLAVVYDADKQEFSMWLDYVQLTSWQDVTFKTGTQALKYPWTIGAVIESSASSFQGFDGWIDEVRLTQRALSAREFLLPAQLTDSSTLAWVHFDGDFTIYPYGTSGKAAQGATSYTKSVATLTGPACAKKLTDGEGNLLVEQNTGSLEIDGNAAEFPMLGFSVQRNITVEFFYKPFEYFSAWSGPLAFTTKNSTSVPTTESTDCWAFDGAGTWSYSQLMFCCCTLTNGVKCVEQYKFGKAFYPIGTRTGDAMTWPAAFDGRWHHVAASLISTAEGNTRIKLWYDYQCVLDKEQPGLLNINANSSYNLIAGAHPYSERPYRGYVDEVRISAGELDVPQFLRKAPKGVVIILR